MADDVTDPRTGQSAPRAKLTDPPTTVRAKLGSPPAPVPGVECAPVAPIRLDGPGLLAAAQDAAMYELKRQTAVNLIVGHVRLIAQVLALPDGCLGDIVSDAGLVFDHQESPAG